MHLLHHLGVDRIYLQVTPNTHLFCHFLNWWPWYIVVEILEIKWMQDAISIDFLQGGHAFQIEALYDGEFLHGMLQNEII